MAGTAGGAAPEAEGGADRAFALRLGPRAVRGLPLSLDVPRGGGLLAVAEFAGERLRAGPCAVEGDKAVRLPPLRHPPPPSRRRPAAPARRLSPPSPSTPPGHLGMPGRRRCFC